MKKFWIGFSIVLGALAAFFLWRRFVAQKLTEIWPRKDDAIAAQASDIQDANSLAAMRMVIPPSAMNVRTTAGILDANPIGGNVSAGMELLSVNRWSPLGSNSQW